MHKKNVTLKYFKIQSICILRVLLIKFKKGSTVDLVSRTEQSLKLDFDYSNRLPIRLIIKLSRLISRVKLLENAEGNT
jgi:hypothetical protein